MNHVTMYDLGFRMLDPLGNELDRDEVPTVDERDAGEYIFKEGSFQVAIPGKVLLELTTEEVVRALVRAANVPTTEEALEQLFGSETKIIFEDSVPAWSPSPAPIAVPDLPPISRKVTGRPTRRFSPKGA